MPDAEPKIEPIRQGGPNKPYEVRGQDYTPLRDDRPWIEKGLASWYGRKFHGRRTASGEVYNMYAMTAAHKTMPLPSYARVRNPKNGREVIVRVNDRGPFHPKRIIDLSYTAAVKLGVVNAIAEVELERITHEQIRTGSWRTQPPASPSHSLEPELAAPLAAEALPLEPPRTIAVAAAAEALDSSSAPTTAKAEGFWIQLGVFRQREGAEQFLRQVADQAHWLAPALAVLREPPWFRLQAGPFPSPSEAHVMAARIRETFQLVPVIVEQRH